VAASAGAGGFAAPGSDGGGAAVGDADGAGSAGGGTRVGDTVLLVPKDPELELVPGPPVSATSTAMPIATATAALAMTITARRRTFRACSAAELAWCASSRLPKPTTGAGA